MHVNLMIADYPGFGHSEGKATLSGCARSVNLALDFLLRQSTKDVPKVILVGRSAGSIFAIDAAEKHADSPRVAGLVLESGVADLGQRLVARNVPLERNGLVSKEVFSDVSRDFNHEEKLKKISVPILIMHTEHDTIVPAFNGEKLARWAGPKLQELVLFKKGDHNSIFMENAVAYEQHLKKFIDTQVKKMPETKNQKLPPAQDCLVEIKAFAPRG
jgi:pimeloyl-ACP methyl ester carboxylesterase